MLQKTRQQRVCIVGHSVLESHNDLPRGAMGADALVYIPEAGEPSIEEVKEHLAEFIERRTLIRPPTTAQQQ